MKSTAQIPTNIFGSTLKGLTYGPDTTQGQAHSYGARSPLEIPVLEQPPGSNLPTPVRRRVTSRDCFIVHSD